MSGSTSEEQQKNLDNLQLHQHAERTITHLSVRILKVPNGFLYYTENWAVFVPGEK